MAFVMMYYNVEGLVSDVHTMPDIMSSIILKASHIFYYTDITIFATAKMLILYNWNNSCDMVLNSTCYGIVGLCYDML